MWFKVDQMLKIFNKLLDKGQKILELYNHVYIYPNSREQNLQTFGEKRPAGLYIMVDLFDIQSFICTQALNAHKK